jgi:hypothetical protein
MERDFGGNLLGGGDARDTTWLEEPVAGLYRRDGLGAYSDDPLHIDIEDAAREIKVMMDCERRTRTEVPNALWVEYGELIAGDGLERVQKFLGLPYQKLYTCTVKMSKGINLDYVENVDELMKSELAGWV